MRNSCEPAGTLGTVKAPLTSAAADAGAPSSRMVAPGSAAPVRASVTEPDTGPCAHVESGSAKSAAPERKKFFKKNLIR